MIEQQILREKFQAAQRAWRGARASLCFALIYMAASVLAALAIWKLVPFMHSPAPWWLLLVPVLVAAIVTFFWTRQQRNRRHLARSLEERMPDLKGLLLTAEELLDKPKLNFLEHRVISQATDHAASHDWSATLTRSKARPVRWFMFFALLLWVNAFLWLNREWSAVHERQSLAEKPATLQPTQEPGVPFEIKVTPGDTEIERGSRLLVEATFGEAVPPVATLVVSDPDGQERERLPMTATVEGRDFGALIPRVDKDARYRIEFGKDQSDSYQITTFLFPALERADVKITPPAYTGLPQREIKNTLKVTAMEASRLDFTFKVNKPVKEAELFGEDKTVLPLKASADDPTVLTASMEALKSQRWRLHLVDDKERANKNPPWISIKVQENQLAKIEIVFPKRDIQVSAIQELPVEARVWDDLGVTQSGVSFSIAGKTKEVTFKHGTTQPSKKQEVKEMLALEHEDAEPRQLVSYHFWAEDKGPKGEVRRAMSDMFFADVRHFEDIFREAESPPSGMPGESKGQTDKLVELQKQVVNATWKLIRDTNAGRTMAAAVADVDVVHESQNLALTQTKEAMEETDDAEIKTALTEAWKSMKDALDPLAMASAEKKRTALNQALTFEQTALEWLHRAQSREHQVMRQNQPSQSSSASQQAKQNQLMNLELKQEEQRYEEEKKASPEQTAEQQENLQVLNRLKELARRQEALAEKIKELQKQIEKAKTEEEKEELASQLQRLQDEQEQLLRDVDDLRERMESPDNAANMAEAKEQLEQTREQVMDAAEKLKQQQLAEAANAATRAQRELESMQEDFKEKTARRFGDEMKQMRQQAREVAEAQKQISETLENQKTAEERPDTSASLENMLNGSQTARQLQEQSNRVNELLENMRQISEQAEGNNPLLHRRLYEAVREAQTGGLEENLEEARQQSRYGNRPDAQEAERQAANAVEKLQQGVEKAAESVLGSETDALRMARAELDKLIEEVQAEAGEKQAGKDSQAGQPGQGRQEGDPSQTTAEAKNQDGQPGQNTPSDQPGNAQQPSQSPGQEGSAGNPTRSENTPQTASSNEGQNAPANQPGDSQQPSQSAGQEGSAGIRSAASQPARSGNTPQTASSSEGQNAPSNNSNRQGSSSTSAGSSGGGDDDRRNAGSFFFDEGTEQTNTRPLTGSGYEQWSDRLRNVEELLNQPELRNEAAKVLDNARNLRIDHERNNEAPQADHLKMRITQPLVELRNRVAEELAKKDTQNPMVPVDRDPVPPAFRDLVKQYYKELGHGE